MSSTTTWEYRASRYIAGIDPISNTTGTSYAVYANGLEHAQWINTDIHLENAEREATAYFDTIYLQMQENLLNDANRYLLYGTGGFTTGNHLEDLFRNPSITKEERLVQLETKVKTFKL